MPPKTTPAIRDDADIRKIIRLGARFEGRSVGAGLTLCWPERYKTPFWRFRYRVAGRQRTIRLGSYSRLSLADARKEVAKLRAQVVLGHDVSHERRTQIAEVVSRAKAEAMTVAKLADDFFQRMVVGRWKHPNIVRARIERDIKPALGKLPLLAVTQEDVTALLDRIKERGAPTMANDVLRWIRRMFDFAIKHKGKYGVAVNPAAALDLTDAGGEEKPRDRELTREELTALFRAMKVAKGFSRQNELTIKLLLALAVRKGELIAAPWTEFDLANDVWCLPKERTKTQRAIDIPLAPPVVEWLQELRELGEGSPWVLPARKLQTRGLPYICESTISVALGKIKHGLDRFTVHDLRRTARTQLSALGVQPHIAEKCLNHAAGRIEETYDRHAYFEERKAALGALADLIVQIDSSDLPQRVIPIRSRKQA